MKCVYLIDFRARVLTNININWLNRDLGDSELSSTETNKKHTYKYQNQFWCEISWMPNAFDQLNYKINYAVLFIRRKTFVYNTFLLFPDFLTNLLYSSRFNKIACGALSSLYASNKRKIIQFSNCIRCEEKRNVFLYIRHKMIYFRWILLFNVSAVIDQRS